MRDSAKLLQRIRRWSRWPIAILAIASSLIFLALLLFHVPIGECGTQTLALQIPNWTLMAEAERTAVICKVYPVDGKTLLPFQNKTNWGLGFQGFHLGGQFEGSNASPFQGLGFALAMQTKTFVDDDVMMYPNAALRTPYWFLIGAPILVFLYANGLLMRLRTMRRSGVEARPTSAT